MPSCSEDKLGTSGPFKCIDGSEISTHTCYEDSSKTSDCAFGAPPVCADGCGYQCTPCPTGIVFGKCENDATPCTDGQPPHGYNRETEAIEEYYDPFDFSVYISTSYEVFCTNNCSVQCYTCPEQPSPLPRCGKTGIPCPENPDDKPILANTSDPLSTNCTDSLCPILCEQCPPDVDPLPRCEDGQNACRDGATPVCEDGSKGYDRACDNGDKPRCADLCTAECDHCEEILDPLPKCGQYNDGVHVRKPCKDNSTENSDGRCEDACLPSCEACADRADPLPMCGKNQTILINYKYVWMVR